MPLKHSTFRWFDAPSCKATPVSIRQLMDSTILITACNELYCRFIASRHTMVSCGITRRKLIILHPLFLIHSTTSPSSLSNWLPFKIGYPRLFYNSIAYPNILYLITNLIAIGHAFKELNIIHGSKPKKAIC